MDSKTSSCYFGALEDFPYRCYTNEKVVDMPKNRAQFTPMRTTAADSITKLFITLDT